MEWKRYPILRLIIPMLIGMIGAFLFYGTTGYCLLYTIPLLILFTTGAIVAHTKNKAVRFGIFITLSFITFGFSLTNRSICNAQRQYGERWSKELYKHSIFENTKAKDVQEKCHNYYQEQGFTDEEGSIIEAMTIGWRQGLSKETKEHFSKAGLSHTLALSGFHITIVFILLHYLFLGKIVTHRWRIISNILVIISLWCYAFIAGMQPSLVRATMMCSILVLTQAFGQKALSINSCLLTAMTMLIMEPLMLFHVGFLLSFSAVIGIITLGAPLCKKCEINLHKYRNTQSNILRLCNKAINYIKDIIIISLVCNIFTIPIVAYTFHQIPLLSIISNLAATLQVSLLIIVSAIWWGTVWCTPINNFAYSILHWTASYICGIANGISSLPYSVYYCKPTILECILMYGIITSFTLILHKNTLHRMMAFLISIIIFCAVAIITILAK